MKKIKKDDIIYFKFKRLYEVIFKNARFIEYTKNHFNSNGGLAAFLIAFLENRIGSKKTLQHITVNHDDWLDLFFDLYSDENIIKCFNDLALNPIVDYDKILKSFDCFDNIIDKILKFLNRENLFLRLSDTESTRILKTCFSYILYNCIDCKLPYSIPDILVDVAYDQKVVVILNNTRLFSAAKNSILENCGRKINDLITMLLAVSKNLYCDKN